MAPIHGDDFNDDLRHGAKHSDYEQMEAGCGDGQSAPPGAAPDVAEFEAAARRLGKNDLIGVATLFEAVVQAGLDELPESHIIMAARESTGYSLTVLNATIQRLKKAQKLGADRATPAWASQLRRDLYEQPERNEANVITALSNDRAFAGAIVFDEFRQECMVYKPLPWSKHGDSFPRPWTDVDDIRGANGCSGSESM